MEPYIPTFGGNPSEHDYRTVMADKAGLPATSHKIDLNVPSTDDLCNQQQLGICTACGVRMTCEHYFRDGVRLSEYWLYLMGKVFYDKGLWEGSSIMTMMKVAKNYGVPTKESESISPLKTNGTYKEFIDDFNKVYGGKIPQYILDNAKDHKIPGYYSVPVEPVSLAREIESGKVLAIRLAVGENTYTAPDGRVSWAKEDLLPLRAPKLVSSGHIVCLNEYVDLDVAQTLKGPNSWSKFWADNGYFNFIFGTQKPFFTEAWAVSDVPIIVDRLPLFTRDLWLGVSNAEVKNLQKFLNKYGTPVAETGLGSKGNETNFFGLLTQKALAAFQIVNSISPAVGYFGPKTRSLANLIIKSNE